MVLLPIRQSGGLMRGISPLLILLLTAKLSVASQWGAADSRQLLAWRSDIEAKISKTPGYTQDPNLVNLADKVMTAWRDDPESPLKAVKAAWSFYYARTFSGKVKGGPYAGLVVKLRSFKDLGSEVSLARAVIGAYEFAERGLITPDVVARMAKEPVLAPAGHLLFYYQSKSLEDAEQALNYAQVAAKQWPQISKFKSWVAESYESRWTFSKNKTDLQSALQAYNAYLALAGVPVESRKKAEERKRWIASKLGTG